MKTINKILSLAGLTGGLFAAVAAVAADDSTAPTNAPEAATQAEQQIPQPPPDNAAPQTPAPTPPPVITTPAPVAPATQPVVAPAQDFGTTNATEFAPDKGLRMNFRGVPLEQVLNYMSRAAGFIIHPKVSISGKVDAWSDRPLSKDEAVDLLEHVLDDNGYTAIRDGRILTIISKVEAKRNDIPVKRFVSIEEIPKNSEIATYIIPVRTLNPIALVKNLDPLKGSDTDLQANESANSLIITDAQNNIRRIADIVMKLDSVSSSINTIKVYQLKYADAKAVVSLIKDLFPSQDQSRNGAGGAAAGGGFGRFGGGGGRGGRGGGAGLGGPGGAGFPGIAALLGGGAGGDNQGSTPSSRIAAVSDDHSNSLIVSAPEDLIPTISELVDQLDKPVEDITVVKLFHLKNADPSETADLLASLFPDPTNPNDASGSRIQFGNRGGGGAGGNPFANFFGGAAAETASAYMQKMGHVVAVPDRRTQSLIVTASKGLMPQIEDMIKELDNIDSNQMRVHVIALQNADPLDVQSVLQDLFPQSGNQRATSTTDNVLKTRATTVQQNQLSSGAGSGSGTGLSTSSGGRGGF